MMACAYQRVCVRVSDGVVVEMARRDEVIEGGWVLDSIWAWDDTPRRGGGEGGVVVLRKSNVRRWRTRRRGRGATKGRCGWWMRYPFAR